MVKRAVDRKTRDPLKGRKAPTCWPAPNSRRKGASCQDSNELIQEERLVHSSGPAKGAQGAKDGFVASACGLKEKARASVLQLLQKRDSSSQDLFFKQANAPPSYSSRFIRLPVRVSTQRKVQTRTEEERKKGMKCIFMYNN